MPCGSKISQALGSAGGVVVNQARRQVFAHAEGSILRTQSAMVAQATARVEAGRSRGHRGEPREERRRHVGGVGEPT
jgi:hypothetical protein